MKVEKKAKKMGGMDFICHMEVEGTQGLSRQFNQVFILDRGPRLTAAKH